MSFYNSWDTVPRIQIAQKAFKYDHYKHSIHNLNKPYLQHLPLTGEVSEGRRG